MAICASLQVQMASVMDVLTKMALAEMTKLVNDASLALRLEMCRSQRENEALKKKLLVMEGELRAAHARGCGVGTSDSSLNIAFEVKVRDEFRKAQNSTFTGGGSIVAAERVFEGRPIPGPVKDEHYDVPVEAVTDALEIKSEPADVHQDWSESVLFRKDWLEEDTKTSQFLQAELKQESEAEGECFEHTLPLLGSVDQGPVSEEHGRGGSARVEDGSDSPAEAESTPGEAAAKSGEGLLREGEEKEHMQPCILGDTETGLQAELKQEQEGEPLTPGHLLPGSSGGLEVQCAWSKSTRSGKVWEMLRQHGGSSEHGGAWSKGRFSPRNFRVSWRLHSEEKEGPASHLKQKQNGRPLVPPDGVYAEMAFALGSQGDRTGSAPCEVSFDVSGKAENCQGIEGREEFVCTCCGKTFSDALELQTHKEQQCKGKRFICLECGKDFACSKVLRRHQRVHTREKLFVCTLCGKSFTQISGLKTHQIIHTGEKCFCCTVCNKNFAYLHVLKRHQRIHTGEKPHHCNECGKGFTHLGNLKTHQRVHSGEKPFSCDKCGKSFAQKMHLKNHQTVHTGEKRVVFCKKFCRETL